MNLTWSGSAVRVLECFRDCVLRCGHDSHDRRICESGQGSDLGSGLSEFWKDREAQQRELMSLHGATPLDGLDADLRGKDCQSMKMPLASGRMQKPVKCLIQLSFIAGLAGSFQYNFGH
jgi:hypothetical protein